MVRTAIQLQTLEALSEPLPDTIERIGNTPLDGVELFGLNDASPNAVAEALEATALDVAGAHVPIGRLEREYEDVVDTYETIGCDRLVVPIYDADAFTSIEGVEALADRLSALGDRVADDGFELLYHNHSFEFAQLEGESAYESLIEATSGVEFEFDTGLAMYAGTDPVALLSRYGERIPMVHLTDSVPGNETTIQVELGAGELDVNRCTETVHDVGVEWLIYEHGQTSDTLGSLAHAATRLPMAARGRDAFAGESSIATMIDDVRSVSEDVTYSGR